MTPVSEHGEIGCALQYHEYVDAYDDKKKGMVIMWMVRKTAVALADSPINEYKKDDKVYYTSMGWVHVSDDHVFMPTERERSLTPCRMRALDFAKKRYPGCRVETH